KDAVVVGVHPRRGCDNGNVVLVGWGKVGFDYEQADPFQRLAGDARAIRPQLHNRLTLPELRGVRIATDAQALRAGQYASQDRCRASADPTVLVTEITFQVVPSLAEVCRVRGKGEVDHVVPIPRVEFRPESRWQKVVDATFVCCAIAAGAE